MMIVKIKVVIAEIKKLSVKIIRTEKQIIANHSSGRITLFSFILYFMG